jgi:hypothetical protein
MVVAVWALDRDQGHRRHSLGGREKFPRLACAQGRPEGWLIEGPCGPAVAVGGGRLWARPDGGRPLIGGNPGRYCWTDISDLSFRLLAVP